jgi:hypothetical protein
MPPRKKNNVVAETVVEPVTETVAEPVAEAEVAEAAPITQKPRAKRTKVSKHQVVAVVSQDGIQGTFTNDQRRPLIAHLPIHSAEVQFFDQGPQYDPNPPCVPVAYEDAMTNPFMEMNSFDTGGQTENITVNNESTVNEVSVEEQSTPVSHKKQAAVVQPSSHVTHSANTSIEYGPSTLLVRYGSSKDTKELPKTTDVACFWCCETFSGRPCVIPTFVNGDVWNVYGNFCTPQCSSAYLLSELLDTHVRWERIALLHRLYASFCGGRIYPAPHRETLERFGGPLPTATFRQICEERKIRADVHLPPMVSILASMDTKPIDFYETSIRNTVSNPPVHHNSDGSLKFKRSKPLKDPKSTLDACLNIQFRVR